MSQHLRVSTGTMVDVQALITALRDILGLSSIPSESAPGISAMYGNFPNPVDSATRIVYSVARPSRVVLHIFDAQGRQVRSLLDENRAPGFHEAWWDRLDEQGRRVPAGCYFYRLGAAEVSQTRRMILL
jgi:hypothetical protein